MKKNLILILVVFGLLFASCSKKSETPNELPTTDNPFFAEWNTPFKVPPFDKIKPEHFIPAYEKGMEQQKAEIDELVNARRSYRGRSVDSARLSVIVLQYDENEVNGPVTWKLLDLEEIFVAKSFTTSDARFWRAT